MEKEVRRRASMGYRRRCEKKYRKSL